MKPLYSIIVFVVSLGILPGALAQEENASQASEPASTEMREMRSNPGALFGSNLPDYIAENLNADDPVTWDIRLPTGYGQERPAGVLVYISPVPIGIPPQGWRKYLDSENLIWVAARDSGNTVTNGKRMAYALMGLIAIDRQFAVDPARFYVSGFSGGGRVASMLVVRFPNAFRGAIYFCGVNFIDGASDLYTPLVDHRFVFISGTFDFNLTSTRRVYARYKNAGLSNSTLIVVPKMEHELPPPRIFEDAIKFLDDK